MIRGFAEPGKSGSYERDDQGHRNGNEAVKSGK